VDSTIATIENTPKNSAVKVQYYGWKTASDKINFTSELTIKPNQRYTQHRIHPSKEIEGICTGIVKQKNTEVLKKVSHNKKWAYLATYGNQSLVPDQLGMAIFYQTESVKDLVDAEFDFLGAWEQEPNGIQSKEEFVNYLDEKLKTLEKNNTM
jgi:hypothetical protein